MKNENEVNIGELGLSYYNLVSYDGNPNFDLYRRGVKGGHYIAEFRNMKNDFFYVRNTTLNKEDKISDNKHEKNSKQGLKFHISVDPNRITEGWDIVLNIMKRHGVAEAKIANPLYIDQLVDGQEVGKEITIYAFKDPHRKILESDGGNKTSWEQIIREITVELYEAGIQPGASAQTSSLHGTCEKQIKGSNYVTWRDDNETLTDLTENELLHDDSETVAQKYLSDDDNQSSMRNELIEYRKYFIDRYRSYLEAFNQVSINLQKININQLDRIDENTHRTNREHNYNVIRGYNNNLETHVETSYENRTNTTTNNNETDQPPPLPSKFTKPKYQNNSNTNNQQTQTNNNETNSYPPDPQQSNTPKNLGSKWKHSKYRDISIDNSLPNTTQTNTTQINTTNRSTNQTTTIGSRNVPSSTPPNKPPPDPPTRTNPSSNPPDKPPPDPPPGYNRF